MTTKKNDDGGKVRAAMAVLSKRTINDLRAAYTKTTGKPANRLSKDALVKTLVATVATEQPAPSHPTRAEQAEAKRRTGPRDPRLPAPGTVIEREYKGKTHKVTVNADDFTYQGRSFRSLSAIARAVTGYGACSGTLFFGIAKPAAPKVEKPAKAPAKTPKAKSPRAKKAK
jgi:hypothetical protein